MKAVEEIVNKEKFEMENSEMFFENKIKNIYEQLKNIFYIYIYEIYKNEN